MITTANNPAMRGGGELNSKKSNSFTSSTFLDSNTSLNNALSSPHRLDSHFFIKKDLAILFGIYLCAYFFMIINVHSYYWDDWAMINFSFLDMAEQFFANGNVWFGYFVYPFIKLGAWSHKLFVFVAFFLSGICLYFVLLKLELFSRFEIFAIVALFLVLPLNNSRQYLVMLPYSPCYLLFFFSWFLISKDSLKLRLAALPLLFISFTFNSLLVMSSLIFLYCVYFAVRKFNLNAKLPINIFKACLKNIDLLVLPILFFIIKHSFFKPYGDYEGYNEVTIANALKAIVKTPVAEMASFSNIFALFFDLGAFVLAFLALFLFVKSYRGKKKINRELFFIVFGLLALFISQFPYMAVEKVPYSLFFPEDRFGYLDSLGLSFMIVFGIFYLFKHLNLQSHYLIIFAIVLCICANMHIQMEIFKSYVKQTALIEHLKENEEFLANDTFIFKDYSGGFGYTGLIRDYELTGAARKAFSTDSKYIGINYFENKQENNRPNLEESLTNLKRIKNGEQSAFFDEILEFMCHNENMPFSSCKEHQRNSNPPIVLVLEQKAYDERVVPAMYQLRMLKLLVLDLFSQSRFKQSAKDLFVLTTL